MQIQVKPRFLHFFFFLLLFFFFAFAFCFVFLAVFIDLHLQFYEKNLSDVDSEKFEESGHRA